MEEDANRARIEIPVKGAVELVVVYADELPTDANDILFILREEEATRQLFLKFAVCPCTLPPLTLYSSSIASKARWRHSSSC